jgi:hypothetical protein
MAQLLFASLPPKAAGEKKDYSFDWSKELGKDGDTITGSTWVVTPAGVTINVTDKPKTNDDQTTTVWLDPSSTPGDYTVVNTITTAQGRTHVATASLKVVA